MQHLKDKKFQENKYWSWTPQENQCNVKFHELKLEEEKLLPEDFFQRNTVKNLKVIANNQIYKLLDNMPKGVVHHIHSDCNDDIQFFRKYVFNYPNIYVSKDLKCWKYGTKQQAQKEGWLKLDQIRAQYTSETQFEAAILKLTQFSIDQVDTYSYKSTAWEQFEKKIQAFFAIFYHEKLYYKYLYHICERFILNGYSRVELRSPFFPLRKQIDQNNQISYGTVQEFIEISESVERDLKKKYPFFSLGLILFGLKMFSEEELQAYIRKIYSIHSHIIVGYDLVQEEDKYPHFQRFQPILQKVQKDLEGIKKIWGVFHAGQTKKIRNSNIGKVVKFGTKRIGHATNLFQHFYLIDEIKDKNICIQISPLSNQFLGYVYDLTQHPAIGYYHLGIPISINSDDPARFGYNGVTPDFYVACHAFGFDLKDMKLLGIYSIQFSLCQDQEKEILLMKFNSDWKEWLKEFQKIQVVASSQALLQTNEI